jgi:two-component system, OmpR family, sensor histidine kinase KdpD
MEDRHVLGAAYLLQKTRLLGQYLASTASLALLTYIGFILKLNLATISLLYLLLVITAAFLFGFWQASFFSLLAIACLDYFFVSPVFHFAISDPQNWVALCAFEVTALAVSGLHGRALRNASEAAIHRIGMEQLYELSRNSLLLDMGQPVGPQLVVLIQRIFSTSAVAIFDAHLVRQDRSGNWNEGEENIARECHLRGNAQDDQHTQTWQRVLLAGTMPVGALAVRGRLSSLTVEALATMSAIAIDRYQSFEKEDRAQSARKGEQLRAAVMDALAHEFKTPLATIQTASSALIELGGLAGAQKDLAVLIEDEMIRLNQLCTQLLLTAKLEADQVSLPRDDINVAELISEIIASWPNGVEGNRLSAAVDDPTLCVRVDRDLLAMIVTQYIDNARKYSKPDTPVKISARGSHDEVLISVHNFGPAIRMEDRERVFDRFYRSADVKDSVSGTGIGLSVVKKAAEAHHGHVWVISDEKEGTTFFLSLPTGARRGFESRISEPKSGHHLGGR